MGDVLPFIARMRASSDWTPAERARLEDLAGQFADHATGVEAVFGVTEEGDPWCVVKDANEEVLVHVARIGGRFVIHYAAGDTIDEGADLQAALSERLGDLAATEDNVVEGPFGLSRHAQILAALMIVAAFFHDTEDAKAAEAHPVAAPTPTPSPETALVAAPAKSDVSSRQDRDAAAHGAALIDPAAQAAAVVIAPQHETPAQAAPRPIEHIAAAASLPALDHLALPAPAVATVALALAAAAPAINVITGTSGDDHLTGTAQADHILGGGGNDVLTGGGAPTGQVDILDGGAGNDTITVDAQTVAIGGQGADTFIIAMPATPAAAQKEAAPSAPPEPHAAEQRLLGVIVDFNVGDGDRVINTSGQAVQLRQHVEITAANGATPSTTTVANLMTVFGFTGHRVDVDVDGDGKVDGYLVMGGHLPPDLLGPATAAHDGVALVGQPANDIS
jgi:hypothetical protein